MLPWLIVAALAGAIVGIVIGLTLAHSLVQGHYSHLITGSGRVAPRPIPQPRSAMRPRAYDPDYDGYYG